MMRLAKKVEGFLEEKSNDVASRFWSDVISRLEEWEELDRPIKSPVEQLFFIEWLYREFHYDSNDFPFFLEAQYQDESTGKFKLDFKVDFIQEVLGWGLKWDEVIKETEGPKLGIEIDGHIWHEKTKKQVQYHKERERFLVANNWKLLRFTGSEVFKNPEKCFWETLEVAWPLRSKYHKELEKELKERKKNG